MHLQIITINLALSPFAVFFVLANLIRMNAYKSDALNVIQKNRVVHIFKRKCERTISSASKKWKWHLQSGKSTKYTISTISSQPFEWQPDKWKYVNKIQLLDTNSLFLFYESGFFSMGCQAIQRKERKEGRWQTYSLTTSNNLLWASWLNDRETLQLKAEEEEESDT